MKKKKCIEFVPLQLGLVRAKWNCKNKKIKKNKRNKKVEKDRLEREREKQRAGMLGRQQNMSHRERICFT